MVLVLDGNSENVAHARSKNGSFLEKKNRFVTTLDLIKGFKQIKLQRLHHTCAPISELPSNISTMFKSVKLKNVNKKQHS